MIFLAGYILSDYEIEYQSNRLYEIGSIVIKLLFFL